MNWIQRHILVELVRHSRRRYTELRPDGVEGNLFLYHLEGLIRNKVVVKGVREYHLSAKGLREVATLSLAIGRTRQQPQVLTAVACRNDQDEYLLTRWRREPNTGLVSLPQGMVHYGQALAEMAALELAEKAGLVAELAYLGVVSVRAYIQEELDRHMLVHVYGGTGVRPGRQDALRPEVSECFWSRLEGLEASEFVPGFYEIARMVEDSREFGVAELTIAAHIRAEPVKPSEVVD